MIKPTEFLDHAERIITNENCPQEVEFRCAVSRAYYSLYHEAYAKVFKYKSVLSDVICEILDKKGRPYDKSRIESLDQNYILRIGTNLHQTIPKTLTMMGEKRIGNDFTAFRDDRNVADYDIHDRYPDNRAREKVAAMKKLILEIKNINGVKCGKF